MTTVTVIDHRRADVAADLVVIQRRAYAIEAELIGFDGIPPLTESVEDLMAAPLTVLAVVDAGAIVGFLGYTVEDGLVDIDRLAVDPAHFRRGHARRLLERLHELHPASDFVVSTGAANAPAIALYESCGYRRVGDRTVADTLVVTDFRRSGRGCAR